MVKKYGLLKPCEGLEPLQGQHAANLPHAYNIDHTSLFHHKIRLHALFADITCGNFATRLYIPSHNLTYTNLYYFIVM
jgi:hypothetical protein